MLMDSFEVENFRSLKHLKLEKLARVNLLVGKNNSGKTSVLEALWTLSAIKTDWLTIIEDERGIEKGKADFRHLFYRIDGSKKIQLTFTYKKNDNSTSEPDDFLTAELSLIRNQPADVVVRRFTEVTQRRSTANALSIKLTFPKTLVIQPIIFELHRAEDLSYFMRPVSENSEAFLTSPEPYSRNQSIEIITTKIERTLLSKKIEQIKIAKKEEPMLQILQQITPRIYRIELVTGGEIYLDLGEEFTSLLPLNLMGEGIQRLLDVITAIARTTGGIVFIDEIDNGLHYSALRILWKGVLQAAREYDVQIFATTHSAEALRHLTWVLDDEEYSDYRADVAAYTLIRANDDTVRSYRYDYEQLDFAMEHDIEVRN